MPREAKSERHRSLFHGSLEVVRRIARTYSIRTEHTDLSVRGTWHEHHAALSTSIGICREARFRQCFPTQCAIRPPDAAVGEIDVFLPRWGQVRLHVASVAAMAWIMGSVTRAQRGRRAGD
jgi:hypothetical protein